MQVPALPSVSVVLPAFNESRNLRQVVDDAVAVLTRDFAEAWEIIVVDDGSTDDTPKVWGEIIHAHGEKHLRLIRHEQNRGYGAALRSGFAAAGCETVFFVDADDQFKLNDLAKFSRGLAGYDLVIGWRDARRDSFRRRLSARLGNWLARVLLQVRVRDINCAFKLFRREPLQAMSLHSEGSLINAELLALASRAGWKVLELPVPHYPRRFGTSTGGNFAVMLRLIPEFFALRRRLASLDAAPSTPAREQSAA